MGLGIGIILIVLGLVFLTVLEVDIAGLDQTALGWILVLAGVLSIVLALVMNAQRSRTTHVEERRNIT